MKRVSIIAFPELETKKRQCLHNRVACCIFVAI
ncbi:MAG TPA: hypothetical protein DEB17_11240 [Chlorobaculum sp.]|uniref:Uncharacterized protein n=1 Tax=Chlorobaculum tepidum (strain ATCC 49652 / DSM 12025 / NBRC 103806 / TLS) TaxID=194439 RepID=Q8KCP1_CHLTE|nr:hypothetical protein CT1372 [Chlorobaculum tepidum TLS]HBU24541.1 hypothetical protein [Chlorobaculum sp.]